MICNVLTLESHIAIAHNGCGTYSCVMPLTPLYHTNAKLHHVNTSIETNTIQFTNRKCKQKKTQRVNEHRFWYSLFADWLEINNIDCLFRRQFIDITGMRVFPIHSYMEDDGVFFPMSKLNSATSGDLHDE